MLRFCLSMLSIEGLCLLGVSFRIGLFTLKFEGWVKDFKIVSEKLTVVRYCRGSNVSKSGSLEMNHPGRKQRGVSFDFKWTIIIIG
jgi:hypothetical protein